MLFGYQLLYFSIHITATNQTFDQYVLRLFNININILPKIYSIPISIFLCKFIAIFFNISTSLKVFNINRFQYFSVFFLSIFSHIIYKIAMYFIQNQEFLQFHVLIWYFIEISRQSLGFSVKLCFEYVLQSLSKLEKMVKSSKKYWNLLTNILLNIFFNLCENVLNININISQKIYWKFIQYVKFLFNILFNNCLLNKSKVWF